MKACAHDDELGVLSVVKSLYPQKNILIDFIFDVMACFKVPSVECNSFY